MAAGIAVCVGGLDWFWPGCLFRPEPDPDPGPLPQTQRSRSACRVRARRGISCQCGIAMADGLASRTHGEFCYCLVGSGCGGCCNAATDADFQPAE